MADGIVFTDGEPLLADSLNTLQQGLYDRIKVHSHTGGNDGPKLGSGSLQDNAVGTAQVHDGAITESKLDAGLLHTLKDGPTTLGRLYYHPYYLNAIDTNAAPGTAVSAAETGAPQASAPQAGVEHLAKAAGPLDGGNLIGNAGNLIGNPGNLLSNAGNLGNIGDIGNIIGGIIGNPILLRSEWVVSPQAGSNIGSVYRQQIAVGVGPSVIHIDFVKPFKDLNYIVTATSEWDRPTAPQPLLVRKRDVAFVELTVPTGLYQDLAVSFNLTIFGDLA